MFHLIIILVNFQFSFFPESLCIIVLCIDQLIHWLFVAPIHTWVRTVRLLGIGHKVYTGIAYYAILVLYIMYFTRTSITVKVLYTISMYGTRTYCTPSLQLSLYRLLYVYRYIRTVFIVHVSVYSYTYNMHRDYKYYTSCSTRTRTPMINGQMMCECR